ncbi:hypothetical protein Ssi03_17170 [Sphaerisporangium siamense]|uniref:DUF11 domain-containing protein n=1 Tax=Sphaerisporangium siamense TaxID=795645 RepID=A0A7W7DDQ6_9ACTN|nr:hypothetical protein [Sphaerisporangium siamense]MBB4704923.1 hypothetical protein [Sphaerisporangium siamense]GII83727.1 hypothetical protein Ssi03_17170 [Sphaerisporangium siamense]
MRKPAILIASLAVAAGTLLLPASAQAAPVPGRTETAATARTVATAARADVAAARPRVNVSYPKGMRRGGYATYTFKVTGARQIQDDGLVLATFLPPKEVSKVRFLRKPPNASCSYRNPRVYCVVRLGSANTLTMQIRVWVKYRYGGTFMADHYWAPVSFESGLTARDYVDQLTRDDRIGRSKTKISLR